MTDRKFTPGPWIMGGAHIYTRPDEPSVAVTVRLRDDWEQNAHLISAAPDLYEALEYAVALQPKDGSCDSWVSDARTALAKARGEA